MFWLRTASCCFIPFSWVLAVGFSPVLPGSWGQSRTPGHLVRVLILPRLGAHPLSIWHAVTHLTAIVASTSYAVNSITDRRHRTASVPTLPSISLRPLHPTPDASSALLPILFWSSSSTLSVFSPDLCSPRSQVSLELLGFSFYKLQQTSISFSLGMYFHRLLCMECLSVVSVPQTPEILKGKLLFPLIHLLHMTANLHFQSALGD